MHSHLDSWLGEAKQSRESEEHRRTTQKQHTTHTPSKESKAGDGEGKGEVFV